MKDDANGSAIHLLSDIRHILVAISLMLGGIGSILFSMAIVHDSFLGLGVVLLLCGLIKVLSVCLNGKLDDESPQNADQSERAVSGALSNKPNTQKED